MADPWWQQVGLTAPPRLAEAAMRPGASLFKLLQIALLEQGTAMEVAEIAERLDALGVTSTRTDLPTALVKAWHGLPPVRRQLDGRLAIDVEYRWLRHIPRQLGLVPELVTTATKVAEQSPVSPPPSVPISPDECAALLACNGLASLSDVRVVAAILEAHGSPMTLSAINALLVAATGGRGKRSPIAAERLHNWREQLVQVQPESSLRLSDDPGLLMGMRAAVRVRAYVLLREQEQKRRTAAWRSSLQVPSPQAVHAETAAATPLRTLVVRAYPDKGTPQALSVLDIAAHSITTVIAASVPAMAALLERADLIVGLEPDRTLAALGLERRCADLTRHARTRRLNRQGRTLRITTAQLISASVGISRPLYVASTMRAYLAEGRETALRRRLESDVKALAAFYRYGRLHGGVRLRWGFLDESRPVEWPGSPGDTLHTIVAAAKAINAPIDIVTGSAPGWAEPWSRAVRGQPTIDYHVLRLLTMQGQQVFERNEIQAARLCTPDLQGPTSSLDHSPSPSIES